MILVLVFECDAGWTKFTIGSTETCLKSVGKSRMNQATSVCNSINAKVPLPKNDQENTDLYKSIQQLGLNSCVLDGNDVAREGQWVDSSGNLIPYTNWNGQFGEPNGGRSENYLQYKDSNKWNDASAEFEENVVCEKG